MTLDLTKYEQKCIRVAVRASERQFKRESLKLTEPVHVRTYLKARFAGLYREEFVCLFLDSQHQLIEVNTISIGTLDAASVYPREVVKAAIKANAAAVVFAHNHPSGISEPSTSDRLLTDRLKAALALIDVRTLDHFVVGAGQPTSFTEKGWI